ncbi:MAG TPA: M15 family metallopeptidase [Actinotalea sp.]|nr:M15 family metallopeptidase [Actinotalea sp.]
MDGISGIQARIAQIEARIGELSPTPVGVVATAGVGGTSTTSFGTVLAGLTDPAPTGVGAGRSLVNANNVPLELLGYGNGRIPPTALSTIEGTSHQMWAPAARSFEAMRAAAAADGVALGITDSYRSYDGQVDVAARKGLYSQGGLAAVPGTSNHGWGMALDLKLDGPALAWMREHGRDFGFEESVPREPWHWEYHPMR